MSRRLVILDCDGVLFDSAAANVGFYNAILERMGHPPLDGEGERMAHWMGSPELLLRLFGHDEDLHRGAREVAKALDYTPFLHLMTPVPGLFETLRRLRERGPTALATNRGSTIPQLLDHFALREHFDVVVGLLDVARPKPAPDMLLHCLERLGVAPAHAIYVGDSVTDHRAAEAAGIDFVAVGDVAPGERRIQRLDELPDLLG